MRILVVTSQFPIAGEPTRGRPILQTLDALGHLATLRILSPVARYPRWATPRSYLYRAPQADQALDAGDAVHVSYPALPLLTRPMNGWLCARALREQARAFGPDLILSYWLYPDAHGALRVARELGVPLVAGARGSDLRVRDPVSRLLTRPVVRGARRLLVVSADLGQVAVRDYAAEPGRIRVIGNGCDASIFYRRDRAAARAACQVAENVQLVLYVGRLVAEKGLRELVAAMDQLRVAHPQAELVLVGDGPLREELAARARDPAQQLRLAGPQSADQVAVWMAACDLLTLPSYSEGHPNVLVEALACGRPVVSTPVGGVPEVVDTDCAILVPPRDAPALARALGAALDRDWDETAMSQRFSRSWGVVAAETFEACAEALAEHRSGSRE